MKLLQIVGFVCIACACAQAAAPVSKTDWVDECKVLEEAITKLDVNGVSGSLTRLDSAQAQVDLLPLLEKLRTAKPLVRLWPAKVIAAVAGYCGCELLLQGFRLSGPGPASVTPSNFAKLFLGTTILLTIPMQPLTIPMQPEEPEESEWSASERFHVHETTKIYSILTAAIGGSCAVGAYTGYRLWRNSRMQRAQKILDLLLKSPSLKIDGDALDVLYEIAALSRCSSTQLGYFLRRLDQKMSGASKLVAC